MVPVRIENRAQLVYLLTEAAELEHSILCCYLFAIFSLKDDVSEGLTEEQLEKIRGWRKTMNEIAVQEMAHLTSACNLLTAIGAAPQLRRPNLPTSPRAYPPAFKLRLVPFSFEAVDQFVLLEQPEIIAVGRDDYRATAMPLDRLGDIFSSERSFSTVGELYRGIEDGFDYLAQKLGEDQLFVGPPEVQTADRYFQIPGLAPVRDLASAQAAIELIVEQGEGASLDVADSHYKRFVGLRDEYAAVLAADPQFVPARPVVHTPYSMVPNDLPPDAEITVIDDPLSADVCNLFDGCYELMVQLLGRLFVHAEELPAEFDVLADVSVGLMFEAVQPLGNALTRLPAGPSHPYLNAGPSFRLSRSATIPAHRESARAVFHERLLELERYCIFVQSIPGVPPVISPVREALGRFAEKFAPV